MIRLTVIMEEIGEARAVEEIVRRVLRNLCYSPAEGACPDGLAYTHGGIRQYDFCRRGSDATVTVEERG